MSLPAACSSQRLIHWLEEGVFDALQHKYLRTMMLGLCDSEDPSVLLEAYECALLCSYCITSHRCQWLYLMVTVSVPVLGKGRSREVSCRVVGLASLSVCLGAAGHRGRDGVSSE